MDEDAYAKHNKPEKGQRPGVYKHPETNQELHAESFPAADAYVRQGWVYDRPLPKRDTKEGSAVPAPTETDEDTHNKQGVKK